MSTSHHDHSRDPAPSPSSRTTSHAFKLSESPGLITGTSYRAAIRITRRIESKMCEKSVVTYACGHFADKILHCPGHRQIDFEVEGCGSFRETFIDERQFCPDCRKQGDKVNADYVVLNMEALTTNNAPAIEQQSSTADASVSKTQRATEGIHRGQPFDTPGSYAIPRFSSMGPSYHPRAPADMPRLTQLEYLDSAPASPVYSTTPLKYRPRDPDHHPTSPNYSPASADMSLPNRVDVQDSLPAALIYCPTSPDYRPSTPKFRSTRPVMLRSKLSTWLDMGISALPHLKSSHNSDANMSSSTAAPQSLHRPLTLSDQHNTFTTTSTRRHRLSATASPFHPREHSKSHEDADNDASPQEVGEDISQATTAVASRQTSDSEMASSPASECEAAEADVIGGGVSGAHVEKNGED